MTLLVPMANVVDSVGCPVIGKLFNDPLLSYCCSRLLMLEECAFEPFLFSFSTNANLGPHLLCKTVNSYMVFAIKTV